MKIMKHLLVIVLLLFALIKVRQQIDKLGQKPQEEVVNIDTTWALTLVNDDYPLNALEAIELAEMPGEEQIDKRIKSSLDWMFIAMEEEGLHPYLRSGYRSQAVQSTYFNERLTELIEVGYSEEEAMQEAQLSVARPGTSEHELGFAADINDEVNNEATFAWLARNAYQYGFIQRYPENKIALTKVSAEPWHYRYVGVDVATVIYEEDLCLEEYLEMKEAGYFD